MKILYIITRAEAGGAQVHVLELLKAIRYGAEVSLAVGEEGFLTRCARELGVPVYIIEDLVAPISVAHDTKASWQIMKLLRQVRPEVVHLHSSKAGMLGRLAAKVAGVPSVFTAHGWAFTDGTSLARKVVSVPSEWLSAKLGSWIITVSQNDFQMAEKFRVARSDRMTVIHNGMPDSGSAASPGALGITKIVMVARFNLQKDHSLLLRALAGVREPFHLQLVGDGPLMEDAKRMSSELRLDGRVSFMGLRTDVEEILSAAHIFVLTSNYEGFPISIVEAMRASLPVVASDVGGVRESVHNDDNGFLVPRGDLTTLRERLRLLITNPEMRAKMGVAARSRYEKEFGVELMVSKTLEVYEKVIGQEKYAYSSLPKSTNVPLLLRRPGRSHP